MSEYAYTPYLDGGPANGKAGAALAAKFTQILSTIPGIYSVCDLGCGNGYLSGLLLDRNYKVTGVDASESGITIARRAYGSRAEFLCERFDQELPRKLARERFDAVTSSDVIEHLYRPADLMECAYELLKPGGVLVLGTPYHGYLKNLALSVLNHWDVHHTVDWDGGHIKFFSVKTLSHLVARSGFVLQGFHYYGRVPFLWKNMICVARREV